jgi:hypothetical protein
MSIVQLLRPSSEPTTPPSPAKYQWWRFVALCICLSTAIGFNVMLLIIAPPPANRYGYIASFVFPWLFSFLPYLIASILVLATPPPSPRWRKLELALILLGAVVLRVILLPVLPDLSRDSWRYLWDARVTLYGYSPYVYPPDSPVFSHLHDFIYNDSRFHNVPTIYPPAAQAIYLLSYLIFPSNLVALKSIFMVFDLVTCALLAFLLYRRGLDLSRCLIYAWCPLPIIEFAIQGHLDVLTITFSLLAVVCSTAQWRGSRVLTGFLIALATLTKFYPLFLLLLLVRRRDWALLVTCFSTIVLAYIPYLILGHGSVFGFFATYASEQAPDAGIVPLAVNWIAVPLGASKSLTLILSYLADLIVLGSASLIVLWRRWRKQLSVEAGAIILTGVFFAISSHILPWYTTALLPWIVLLIGPLWKRRYGLKSVGLATLMAWYFVGVSIILYLFDYLGNWNLYYQLAYLPPLLGLALAGSVALLRRYGLLNRQISKQ